MTRTDRYQLEPMLERSIQGDAEALNQLLTTLQPYLQARLRSRLGRTSANHLDDAGIVQNSLLRISRNLGKLQQRTVPGFLGWVGRIVHFALVDALREQSRDPLRKFSEPPQDVPGHFEKDPCVLAEEHACIHAALDQLSDREQAVVRWRFFDRLSDEEISTRLNSNVAAVRVLRYRALQRLRHKLAPLFRGSETSSLN